MDGTQASSAETPSQAQPQNQTADVPNKSVIDDEIDFGDGLKFKKSEAAKRLKQTDEITKGAHAKFQEAAQIRKQSAGALEIADLLTKDVRTALAKAGVKREDMVKVAESILSDEIAEASMDPRDRELRDAKSEAEKLKAERAKHEEEQQQVRAQAEVAHYEKYFSDGFAAAIQKSKAQVDEFDLHQMALKLEAYLEAGETSVTFDQILSEVLEQNDTRWDSRMQSWDDEQLERRLGEKGWERLRKRKLSGVNSPSATKRTSEDIPHRAPQGPRRRLTEYELKQIVRHNINK